MPAIAHATLCHIFRFNGVSMSEFTHINASGEANMVDVSAKAETVREARAEAFVKMSPTMVSVPYFNKSLHSSQNNSYNMLIETP